MYVSSIEKALEALFNQENGDTNTGFALTESGQLL